MSKKACYKFTLLSASYSSQEFSCKKPYEVVLEEGDPKFKIFRDNPSFKEEPVSFSISEAPAPGAQLSELEGKYPAERLVASIEDVPGIPKNVVQILMDNGIETVKAVLSSTIEELTQFSGIGVASATKAIEECQEFASKVGE